MVLYRSQAMLWLMLGVDASRLCVFSRVVDFNSSAHGEGISSDRGVMLDGTFNHWGPFLHSLLTDNSTGVNPLEGISAGFSFPLQWSQHSTGTNWRISLTRFCTKGFHSLPVPFIQNNATSESVKHFGFSKLSLISKLSVTFTTR